MRVLLVSHQFPPAHTAGTETYTAELGLALARRGHHVAVFTSEKDVARPDFELGTRTWNGLPVSEVINNLFHERFSETYDAPAVEAHFAGLLARERPDVVHFQHLMYLSVGCVELARASGATVLFTLQDYWLQCARMGQRVHADSTLCERIDFARCGECLTSFKWAQSPLERSTGRWLARVRSATGVDLSRAAKGLAGMARSTSARPRGDVDRELAAELTSEVATRDAVMRTRVVPNVARFIATSRFARERYVEWGVPSERIEFLRTGCDTELASRARVERAPHAGRKLRVVFIGTLVRHKGAHVLLEAWRKLSPRARELAELAVFGPAQHAPDYQRELIDLAALAGAQMGGALSRAAVASELARADLLVVPSTWWENAPLVMLEAIASGTPILASNLGGMAELVDDFDCGSTFAAGDTDALAREMERVIVDPRALDAFYARTPALPRFEDQVTRIEELYGELRRGN